MLFFMRLYIITLICSSYSQLLLDTIHWGFVCVWFPSFQNHKGWFWKRHLMVYESCSLSPNVNSIRGLFFLWEKWHLCEAIIQELQAGNHSSVLSHKGAQQESDAGFCLCVLPPPITLYSTLHPDTTETQTLISQKWKDICWIHRRYSIMIGAGD